MKQRWVPFRAFRSSQASPPRVTKRLPLRPRSSQEADQSGVTPGSNNVTTPECRVGEKVRKRKKWQGHRPILFDQKTIDNTEKNHRQECSLRGPHPQCDLCIIPPIEPLSLEEPLRRSKITFCRKVLVKPIAHHADIKRRGGEWETLRESLDREDEYFILLNDEEPVKEEDVGMSGQQGTADADCEDEYEVKTEIYYDGQEDNETAETPPNDVRADDMGLKMLDNRSQSDPKFEDGNDIVQHTDGIVVCVFDSGSTEGCGAPWSAEPEETQEVVGIRSSCGILSIGEEDKEENSPEEAEEGESMFEECDWEAADTDDDSDKMVTNSAVTVESFAVKNGEPLPNTCQLPGGIGKDEPFTEKKDEDQNLFLAGDWEMTDSGDNTDRIPVIMNPALTPEGTVFSNNQEPLPDTRLEREIAAQAQLTPEVVPLLGPIFQERKRSNPSDIVRNTVNNEQSRVPFWVIKRRKIYPDIPCNRNQQS
ncbi:hypothetical protein EV426DRAFT_707466 [Tirmania nivea]|nr:hypothetical protein EV426DRAFT_707466 [Tirmania nivea]